MMMIRYNTGKPLLQNASPEEKRFIKPVAEFSKKMRVIQVVLQFCLFGVSIIKWKCSEVGELFVSKKLNSIRDHLLQRSTDAQSLQYTVVESSSSPLSVRKMSVQQQWVNAKLFSGKDCQSNAVYFYLSIATGICIQNDTSSSYISSASALPNGNFSVTQSFYSDVQCSGDPSQNETGTIPNSCCINSDGTPEESWIYYSITNSIPPMPGGILSR